MNKLEELDKLDKAIKEAEINLTSILTNIDNLDKEINTLYPKKNELEQNIGFHKRSGTIPLASEYKKSKTELSQVQARLNIITSERNRAYDASRSVQKILDKFKRDHAALLRGNENNVLRVLFGRKRGKR